MRAHLANVSGKIGKSGNGSVRSQQLSTIAKNARKVEERKIKVDDVEINYARVGTGDHPVLLMPGALGTIWTHFKAQLENLDADKLTIVAWDPPGLGKSRPPDRIYSDDFLERDATYAHNLMKTLGYSKFSLIGWSIGGYTSLLLASMYPDSILKMIVFCTFTYILPHQIILYEKLRDINNWTEEMKISLTQIYGEDYFQKICSKLADILKEIHAKPNDNHMKPFLSKIKCPSLIIHGKKDTMITLKQSKCLKQNIADSKLHLFEEGNHNLHLKYPEEFNRLVTDFLVNKSKL